MLLRLLEEKWPLDIVYFFNTGMEFDCIYRLRDETKQLLESKGIEFVELTYKYSFEHMMIEHLTKYKNKEGYHQGYGWCGGGCRWGTGIKMDMIEKFKRACRDSDIVDYVGIAADEPERFGKEINPDKRMPLVEWNMTEADCLAYCRARGYNWIEHTPNGDIDLYDILKRVSCWCCRNKNYDELRQIYWKLPHYWKKLKELQDKIPEPFKKRTDETIDDIEIRFNFERDWIAAGNKLNTRAYYAELKKRQEASRSERKSGEIKFS